jgi:hypothetical protein
MRKILFILIAALITSMSLIQGSSLAGSQDDSVNGNRIAEPKLQDYVRAERTPGFSAITDVRDANGDSVKQ